MNKRILTNKMIKGFFEYLRDEEKSRNTVDKYKRDIALFCNYVGDREITKALLVDYKQYIIGKGYAERSVNSMLASVNSLMQYSQWYDLKLKYVKIAPEVYIPEEKELSQKEYKRLVFTAMKQGNYKTALILQTICSTGIRVSELQFITVEAVMQREAKVNCKGKIRKVFISNDLRKLLSEYIRKNKIKTGTVFLSSKGKPIDRTTVWREMKKLCSAANVNPSKVFPHNLRHLFARMFYKLEKDIAKLADVLGHSSINTTRIYILSSGSEHKKLIDKLGLILYEKMQHNSHYVAHKYSSVYL